MVVENDWLIYTSDIWNLVPLESSQYMVKCSCIVVLEIHCVLLHLLLPWGADGLKCMYDLLAIPPDAPQQRVRGPLLQQRPPWMAVRRHLPWRQARRSPLGAVTRATCFLTPVLETFLCACAPPSLFLWWTTIAPSLSFQADNSDQMAPRSSA